jgi:hypothetical protein
MAASGDYWLPCSPQPIESAVTEMVTGGLKLNKKTATPTASRIHPVGFFGSNATLARPIIAAQCSGVMSKCTGVGVSAHVEQQGGDVSPPSGSSEVWGCPVRGVLAVDRSASCQ